MFITLKKYPSSSFLLSRSVPKNRASHSGFTLIELVLTLGIVASLLVLVVQSTVEGVSDLKDQASVQHLKEVEEAYKNYIRDHHGDIVDGVPGIFAALSIGESTASRPAGFDLDNDGYSLGVGDLVLEGYLRQSFKALNPYGQGYAFVVHRPSNEALEYMVYTTGGEEISSDRAASIAAQLGSSGGIFARTATEEGEDPGLEVQGSFGGWHIADENWIQSWGAPSDAAANRLATVNANINGENVSDYLARVLVPDQGTEPNTMRAELFMTDNLHMVDDSGAEGNDIHMHGNNIDNAGAIVSASLTVTDNATINNLDVTNNLRVGGDATIEQDATIGDDLTVGDEANVPILHIGDQIHVPSGTIDPDDLLEAVKFIAQLKQDGSNCQSNDKTSIAIIHDDGTITCSQSFSPETHHHNGLYASLGHSHGSSSGGGSSGNSGSVSADLNDGGLSESTPLFDIPSLNDLTINDDDLPIKD